MVFSIFPVFKCWPAPRLGKFCSDAVPGSISSEGNELLVQFASDLSVAAVGFSASYKTLPRALLKKGQAPAPAGN